MARHGYPALNRPPYDAALSLRASESLYIVLCVPHDGSYRPDRYGQGMTVHDKCEPKSSMKAVRLCIRAWYDQTGQLSALS